MAAGADSIDDRVLRHGAMGARCGVTKIASKQVKVRRLSVTCQHCLQDHRSQHEDASTATCEFRRSRRVPAAVRFLGKPSTYLDQSLPD